MITPNCTFLPCEPQEAEPLPGAQLPCGAYANCDEGGGGGTGGLTSVAITDSTTVDLSGNGTSGNPISAAVKVAATSGNLIVETPDGLYAELPAFTSYIDLAMSASTTWLEDEYLFAHQFQDTTTIPAAFDRSIGMAANHTGTSPVVLLLNDAPVTTINLVDGEFDFTALGSDLVCNRGDVLALRAQSVATFDYAALTLVGTRTVRYV